MRIGKKKKKIKNLIWDKTPEIWHFFLDKKDFYDFFKIIFNKLLDFFVKCAHTMRAFKLGTVQKQISTPEISAVYGTTNETGVC